MPKLKSVGEVIKSFTKQYDQWASKIQKEQRNTMGKYLHTDNGDIYLRNMARGILSGDLVVCVASVEINREYQNKGILSSFIKHVQKNPYAFSELEIENIQTKELLNSFINKGFRANSDVNDIEFMALTVFKEIKVKKKNI
jgi:hypothetical protein